MKLSYVKTLILVVCVAGVIGCNEPSAETADGGPVMQSGSTPNTALTQIEIEVDEPNPSSPLAAAAVITPATVKAGDTVTFAIRAKTADTWHIYAFDHAGVGVPTKLELELPADLEAEGEWAAPEAVPYPSIQPSLVFEGDLLFQHTLKIAGGAAPGPREVKCKFGYQTCNESFCNPPTSMELSAIVEVE
jgi:hypothetical protein